MALRDSTHPETCLAPPRRGGHVGTMTRVARLPDRGVLAIAGADRTSFLQGLVSNDVTAATPGRAVWAALLTPQGKWLADFFILADADRLLLDCERAQADMLLQRLRRYRLRAAAELSDQSDALLVHAAWAGNPAIPGGAIAAPDPRLPDAGWRVLSPLPLDADATADEWDSHRLALGLPDGSRDMEAEKTVLLEAGFDELGGVSWSKGCYMGQELTARTKYRGLVKRRLVPVAVAGAAPPPGTPVVAHGTEVGTMRSSRDGLGMAQLRIELAGPPARLRRGASGAACPRLDAPAPACRMSGNTRAIDWEARFRADHTPWERQAENPAFLAWRASAVLTPGKILVPGAGRSPEPASLARDGFAVTVVDAAASAVAFQRERLAGTGAEVQEADLFSWEPPGAFDAVYDQTCLCALPPEHWRAYVQRLEAWIRPGGVLAILFMQTGREGGPPFHCDLAAMRRLFSAERWEWPEMLPAPVEHPRLFTEQPAALLRR